MAVFFAVASSGAAPAQTPPAAASQAILHLSETSQRDIARDLLRASLAVELDGPDAAKLQAEINRRMTAALARIKAVPGIDVETTGYVVSQERPAKGPPLWRGKQSIALAGKDFATLLALVGALQRQGLVVEALAPDLSRDARQAVEDELTDTALARLKQRAARVAATLGTKVEGFRDIRIGSALPPPRFAPMMAAAAAPAPAIAPGTATVSVTVNADIVLAK